MPGKYGSVDVVINYDAAPGGTLSDVTQHVRELGGVKIENLTQETHSFGDPWIEHTPTGIRRVPAIAIKGLFDTTAATGPHVVFHADDGGLPAVRGDAHARGDLRRRQEVHR